MDITETQCFRRADLPLLRDSILTAHYHLAAHQGLPIKSDEVRSKSHLRQPPELESSSEIQTIRTRTLQIMVTLRAFVKTYRPALSAAQKKPRHNHILFNHQVAP
jgi:hypothetical protein